MDHTGTISYTLLWVIWILQFAAIEGSALLNKDKGDTLSEHVYQWFAIGNKPTGWLMRRGSLVFFLMWLVTHFLFRERFFFWGGVVGQ